ncbi:MAG: helix-turn-helix transcriptional regulator [SAR202 cluster bacterium]|jgi:DNA-binding CsgD family transcriptional regulator|nr:helix-turn-helix transcriptional regulator [SAR202 cluster bacterium]MDP6511661.1 helix-turn-helix transcriptional regulator [SAR202 cluster bacterium]MDP6714531.1 helix-turn-helix transcriptional regulator [SAR202 cluster bacterium]
MREIEGRLAERQEDVRRLGDLTETAVILGDLDAARTLADQLMDMTNSPGMARRMGEAADLCGESDRALKHFHKALEVSINTRDRPETAITRFDMAKLLLGHYPERRDEAMRHLEFAIAEFRDMKMRPSLDPALALMEEAESGPSRRTSHPGGLTPREFEVLGLIAKGASNREIGNELFLTVRTVERHTTNIYKKIDARGRADAIAYALRHEMNGAT